MFESQKCPKCGDMATDRNIRKETLEIYSCQNCKTELHRQVGQAFTNLAGLIADELSRIADWLKGLRSLGHEVHEATKDRHWIVDKCDVHYNPMFSGRLDVTLSTRHQGEAADKVLAKSDTLLAICAGHGVQISTSKREHTSHGTTTVEASIGAQQSIAVHVKILPEIFKPIAQRLEAAMMEVVKELSA